METVKTIEDLQEGDVLTFGGLLYPYVGLATFSGGRELYTFDGFDVLHFSDSQVKSFLGWGAITREEPKEITQRRPVWRAGAIQSGNVVFVPAQFMDEEELEVTFKKVNP